MGEKGGRYTSDTEASSKGLFERIGALGDVSTRKMFGGIGIFRDGVMFGIVDSHGEVFFRGGETNMARIEEAGCTRHGTMPYYSVPEPVMADDEALVEWAQLASRAARAAKK